MIPFKFTIPTFTQAAGRASYEVNAVATSVDGILLTEAREQAGEYRLTHRPSGLSITNGDMAMTADVLGLLKLAATLGTLGDWTRSATEIDADQGFKAAIHAAVAVAAINWRGVTRDPLHEAASMAARKGAA